MATCNVKFMYGNMLRAAELTVGPDVMFSDGVSEVVKAWSPVLRMNSVASSLALINVVSVTTGYSWVSRTAGDSKRIPLNLYTIILARSCMFCFVVLLLVNDCDVIAYGKSEISNLIRCVLQAIRLARGEVGDGDLCVDEFSRAGLLSCLQKCTKLFIADEADVTFADAGLFLGFPRLTADSNCRGLFLLRCAKRCYICLALMLILYDRMLSRYVRRLSNKTIIVEDSKLNLLVS